MFYHIKYVLNILDKIKLHLHIFYPVYLHGKDFTVMINIVKVISINQKLSKN